MIIMPGKAIYRGGKLYLESCMSEMMVMFYDEIFPFESVALNVMFSFL